MQKEKNKIDSSVYDAKYESYLSFQDHIPFVLHPALVRTAHTCTAWANWHDNPELQMCLFGSGTVHIDGSAYPFSENDIVYVPPGCIHHTGTAESLTYACLILDTEFCRDAGFDFVRYASPMHFCGGDTWRTRMTALIQTYQREDDPLRGMRLRIEAMQILIALCESGIKSIQEKPLSAAGMDTVDAAYENFAYRGDVSGRAGGNAQRQNRDTVKRAIQYLQLHYNEKITLPSLAKQVYCDQYALMHHFRQMTGQTVISYLNRLRCQKAKQMILDGMRVSCAAQACGFENLSYFSRTFYKHIGMLPSQCEAEKTAETVFSEEKLTTSKGSENF